MLIWSYVTFGCSLKSGFVQAMFVMDQVLPVFQQLAQRAWSLNSVQVNRNVIMHSANFFIF